MTFEMLSSNRSWAQIAASNTLQAKPAKASKPVNSPPKSKARSATDMEKASSTRCIKLSDISCDSFSWEAEEMDELPLTPPMLQNQRPERETTEPANTLFFAIDREEDADYARLLKNSVPDDTSAHEIRLQYPIGSKLASRGHAVPEKATTEQGSCFCRGDPNIRLCPVVNSATRRRELKDIFPTGFERFKRHLWRSMGVDPSPFHGFEEAVAEEAKTRIATLEDGRLMDVLCDELGGRFSSSSPIALSDGNRFETKPGL